MGDILEPSLASPDGNNENEINLQEERNLEREHFQKVVQTFLFYKTGSMMKIERHRDDFGKIPPSHQQLLPNYMNRLEECKKCIEVNDKLIREIVELTDHMFQNADYAPQEAETSTNTHDVTPSSLHKVVTTLTQIVRDWAAEGKSEREQSYGPIIKKLESLYKEEDRSKVCILVPGAGLGRLMFEIAKLGFACQGNEFSLFMLFASNYILNTVDGKNSITFYPWVHQFCNLVKASDQCLPVQFPDVDPTELPFDANFSMAAGDFLEIYTQSNTWDCVTTCFFIDTAHNIIAYLEKINAILKPGGYWINNGPLLYHFADVAGQLSIEISYEELRRIILQDFKFELINEDLGLKSYYIQNPRSMLKMSYDCAFFVVRKPFL